MVLVTKWGREFHFRYSNSVLTQRRVWHCFWIFVFRAFFEILGSGILAPETVEGLTAVVKVAVQNGVKIANIITEVNSFC